MKRTRFIAGVIIAFVIFALTAIFTRHFSDTKKASQQKAFEKFTDTVFVSELSSNAFNLHFYLKNPTLYGIKEAPEIIGHVDYDEMKDSEDYYLNMINSLKAFDYNKLSTEGKQTYDVFMHSLSTELAFPDLCLNYELLSPTVGIQAQLPVLLSQYIFNNEQDVITYLNLINSVPQFFNEIISFQKIKADKGTFMSKTTADGIIAQCTDFALSKDNFLIETFRERMDSLPFLTAKQKNVYCQKNEDLINDILIPSYKWLANELETLKPHSKNQLGLCYNKKGKNYYQYLVSSYTGSSRTVKELEDMIKKRMNSDISTLTALMKKDSVYEALVDCSTDVDTRTPDAILKELITRTEEYFPSVPCKDFDINYVPKALEEYLSPAFYLSPPIDDPHNNQIFINQHEDFKMANLYATLAHEGYPGHLYQTTYYNSTNPPLLRNLLDFGGYSEGWATYVELYSYNFKQDDPVIVKALQANDSYSLALYCLADIGINYRGWDFEKTTSFFEDYGITDKTIVKEIFDTMIAEPANYLQYYVGYLEILELQKLMKEKLGDAYTDLAFHTYLLDFGPAPFEVLAKYINIF